MLGLGDVYRYFSARSESSYTHHDGLPGKDRPSMRTRIYGEDNSSLFPVWADHRTRDATPFSRLSY